MVRSQLASRVGTGYALSMSPTAAQLLADALALPESERTELAVDLLASLPGPDERTDAEWLAEVERRARAARDGAPGVAWPDAREQIRAALRPR
jgi:putative addiction module component (TIGR02574 family)